jgi:cytochrome P450
MYPVTTEEAMQAAMQATGSMVGYFTQILEERRAHPQNDLVSALLMAEVDGERLSTEELMGFCVLLLVAGNETTTNLIGNVILCLAEPCTGEVVYPDLIPGQMSDMYKWPQRRSS